MRAILDRYKGKHTPKGHDIRVDEDPDGVTLWYLYWGEYEGRDDHHHFGIARVRREKDKYALGTFHATEQEPGATRLYDTEEEVMAEIDKLLAQR